jgi:plastocyanin
VKALGIRSAKVLVGLLAIGCLVSCSGGDATVPAPSSAPWSTSLSKTTPTVPIEIQMVGYRYIPNELRVRAGKVVFYLVNPASETYAHNMVITDPSGAEVGRSPNIPPDSTAVFTVRNLPPGAYDFGSTLEGIGYSADGTQASHGMVGRLSVLPDYKDNSSTTMSASRPGGSTRILMVDLRFVPSNIQVNTNNPVFYLVSPVSEGLSHNMVITDVEGRVVAASAGVDPGQSAVFSVRYLPAGVYDFMSTMGGPDDPTQHYQADAGMVGTLTVTS